MDVQCEKTATTILDANAEAARQFLEEAVADFRNDSLQESLEKMVVLETLTREMIGAVKEERDKRSEKAMVAPKVKRPVRHVMWYELKDKYLPDHWKRNRDYRNEMEDTVLCQSTSHETRLETLPIKEELIETLGLSVRSENCLHRAGIETIGKLSDTTAADLKRIRNLGKKCLDEIIEKLAEKELTLREEEAEGEIVSFVEFQKDIAMGGTLT